MCVTLILTILPNDRSRCHRAKIIKRMNEPSKKEREIERNRQRNSETRLVACYIFLSFFKMLFFNSRLFDGYEKINKKNERKKEKY